MIADKVNVNREAVRWILTEELGMRKICVKMVPRNLTQQQRDARVRVCAELLEQVEADPEFMERVITGDESWFFQTPKYGMAFEGITKAKESTHIQVKSEMHACVLL